MDDLHNRGSPKLQFTEEELVKDALSQPAANAEPASDGYDEAHKRLRKRYQRKVYEREMGVQDSASALPEDGEITDDAKADPKAPGVQNTRQKPKHQQNQSMPGKSKQNEAIPDTIQNDSGTESLQPAGKSGKKAKGASPLSFEKRPAKKPSRLIHPVQKTIRTAGDQLHRQAVKANEDDNVALDAVLRADQAARSALQSGEHAYHARKLRQYRRLEKAEKRPEQAHIRVQQTRYQQEQPQFTSNPYSRWQQKRAIRKEYAAVRHGFGKQSWRSAGKAEQAAEKTGEAAAKAANTMRRHPGAVAILALGALLLFITANLQSCAPLMESLLESLAIGSYPAEEADVLAAEQVYLDMENALKDELAHYAQYHPGNDEYVIELDDIGHDPYVLMAIISACADGEEWDLERARPIIEQYFHRQYLVTETITTKSYRDDDGELQRRTVCTVTLKSENLSHLPVSTMTHHTLSLYALYMSTHGNMEGIFTGPHAVPLKEPMLYDIPQETLDADPAFARLMEEATRYIGFPYVWGGSDPDTSFDCSGFVCYVFTASGIRNTGRLGAAGIHSLCRPVAEDQLKPGDIVFFEGTMGDDVEGITHCGIYVGNNMMLHCGSPIGYADLTDAYWQQHFHSYGRIPH